MSTAVLVSRLTQCPFAVRSGGHSDIPGASNIAGGVTIDLSKMKLLQVSADKKITQTGPGNRWGDVYKYLDPQGLTVIGGRESGVGVGGLVLGGMYLIPLPEEKPTKKVPRWNVVLLRAIWICV